MAKQTTKKAADKEAEDIENTEDNNGEPLKKYTDGPTISYPVPDADPQPVIPAPDFVPAIDGPDGKDNSSDSEDDERQDQPAQ